MVSTSVSGLEVGKVRGTDCFRCVGVEDDVVEMDDGGCRV